jgi:predicted nuclease of restriction endonuclease-like (RecB) superfamily
MVSTPRLDYQDYLAQLKERIRSAQVKAALAVNRELVLLYWGIGRDILQRQAQQGWGTKVIDQLARDLKQEFPEMSGFSSRNLKYMRAFADAYPADLVVQQSAGQLSGEPYEYSSKVFNLVGYPYGNITDLTLLQ